MAVQFDINLAINDEIYARNSYIQYCNGELEISNEDLDVLKEQYKGKIADWKPEETTDQNEYTIEDDNNGDDTAGKITRTTGSAASVAAGAAGLAGATIGGTTETVASSTAAAAAGAGTNTGINLGIIGCLIAFAEGLIYTLTNPNKAEHKELMDLQNIMEGKLGEINGASDNIVVTQEEIDAILAEYENDKDAITAAIEEKTQELNTLKEERQALQDRIDAGEELDESEQTKYEELNGQIGTLSHEVAVLNAALTQLTEETEEDVNTEGQNYEDAINVALTAEEAAEKAAEFDEQTKANATAEAVIQGVNVVGGALSIASVAPEVVINPFAAAAAVAGASGVVMSGIGIYEQTKIAIDIADEIEVRKNLFGEATGLNTSAQNGLTNTETSVNNLEEGLPEEPGTEEEPTPQVDFSVQPPQGEEPESGEELIPEEDPKKKPEDV